MYLLFLLKLLDTDMISRQRLLSWPRPELGHRLGQVLMAHHDLLHRVHLLPLVHPRLEGRLTSHLRHVCRPGMGRRQYATSNDDELWGNAHLPILHGCLRGCFCSWHSIVPGT